MMAKPSSVDVLITNPLAQPGVVETVPDGVFIVDLDDMPYRAEPQVHCCFCKHRQPHNDGYFAILSNGKRSPCGNCCAAKFDPIKKHTIDKRRTQLTKERASRERYNELVTGLDILILKANYVDEICRETALAIVVLRNVLSSEVLNELQAKGIQGLDFLGGSSARLDFVRKVVGGLRGRQEIKVADAEHLHKHKREAMYEIEKALSYVTTCEAFFDGRNLAAIGEWVKESGSNFGIAEFRLKGHTLHIKADVMWRNIELPVISPLVL